MKYLINKLSALFAMLVCMSVTVQAEIVKHEVCEATVSSRGFTQDCWEDSETGKFYADEACTQELTGAELAKTVTYAKLYKTPLSATNGFSASESENDWNVQFNWAAMTTFEHPFYNEFDNAARYAEFKLKNSSFGYPRLVWMKDHGDSRQGKFSVKIYVNDEEKYSVNQDDGKYLEGVFVLPLPDITEYDVIKFEVKQIGKAEWPTSVPTFKACLEYTIPHCFHTSLSVSVICQKCGIIQNHSHNYDINTHVCTRCGETDESLFMDYVGSDDDRMNIKWTLTANEDKPETYVLTFTGSGDMEVYNQDHNANRYYNHTGKITKVVIGEGITSIGQGVNWKGYFSELYNLAEVSLPSTLTKIGSYAFHLCRKLQTIELPNNLTYIGTEGFSNSGLISITLPEGIETIKVGAFADCKSLTSINIPASVKAIDKETFYYCTSLKSVTLPEGLISIRREAFIGSAVDKFELPLSLRYMHGEAFNKTNIYIKHENADDLPYIDGAYGQIEATLHISNCLLDWVKTNAPWNKFRNIVPLCNTDFTDANDDVHSQNFNTEANDNTFTLPDGIKSLNIYEDIPMQQLTYTRNFSTAGQWQSLFVPFDIEITEAILDKCDIAKPYMVATDGATKGNFNEGDGADIVVLKKLNAGDVTKHGTAYYIRPKDTGAFQLVLNDVTLYATDATSTLSCATTEDTYEFIGQYAAGKPASGTWYALAGGGFHLGDNASPNISAMRWYMTKTSKSGSLAPAPARIRIMTWGEDDATAIMDNQTTSQSDNAIYSLSGVRLSQPKKGMNIVNGKKVIIR